MSIKRRIISAVLVLVMLFAVLHAGSVVKEQERQNIFDHTKTLHIWYTDEALTDHLSSMAVKFNEENGIRVIPVLQSGLELLEKINEASLTTDAVPDLFIASNDLMEKAYLSGLAMEISNPGSVVALDNFPESAMHAVTYQQKILGYPYYFETSALLYNMTYLEDMAKRQIQEEMAEQTAREEASQEDNSETKSEENASKEDKSDTKSEESPSKEEASVEETAEEAEDDEELKQMIHERIPELIPTTFESLLEFADNYDAPEHVEAVFKWDVSDIFYNYFFAGNYIKVGGDCGDNTSDIDIYNLEAIKALKVYQDLSQYFAIEADEVEYESVIQDFMEGKIVMTTATTDVIGKLEAAKESGEFTYDYGIATIPDLNQDMQTKGLSVTNTIYVNGYTGLKKEANDFAKYLVIDHAQELYDATGKVSANINVSYENPNLHMFMKEYQDSVPMPKMMATSNFWVKMEIMFDHIWNGADISKELKGLSEDIMTQITGTPYVEETYIELPKEEEDFVDYSDEEE